MLSRWFAVPLWKRILSAVVLGVITGMLWPPVGHYIGWMGEIFVRLIRMVVVPLVLVTITAGITALGDVRKAGSIGIRAIGLFAGLTLIAASAGIALALIFQPGRGAALAQASAVTGMVGKPIGEQLLGIIPSNPFFAVAQGDMLAIIFFAIVAGLGILAAGDIARPIQGLLSAASSVMAKIISGVLETAPFGVFALVAIAAGQSSSLTFVNVSLLALAVVCGSLFETLVVHCALVWAVARLSLWRFLSGAADAVLVAFSTGSSSATLPVAIAVAERNLGVGKAITSTVLPIGASIGRDGTAMYVALLAVFSAQVFGISLHVQDYVRIVLATSLVALGTAPVPSASLFMLAAVLAVIGIDDARTALIVGFVLPFDSLFNMVRTVPNATTNLAVAVTIARPTL